MVKTSLHFAIAMVMLCLVGGVARADHPAYLHALTDLRAARAHLARPAGVIVKWDENRAIREIDAAIKEIKGAAIDDGKPLEDHPPIDVAMDWKGRLHHSLELVQRSYDDVNKQEDNAFARGLKHRALEHMQGAINAIKEGITEAEAMHDAGGGGGPGAAHPAYLHALSDLRLARGYLHRPTRSAAVKWDENTAIREIEGAIKEIKDAAVDDGKTLDQHAPVDASMAWGGRLQKAFDLVSAARADIDKREDDKFARGMKQRAIHRLDAAITAIRAGQAEARH